MLADNVLDLAFEKIHLAKAKSNTKMKADGDLTDGLDVQHFDRYFYSTQFYHKKTRQGKKLPLGVSLMTIFNIIPDLRLVICRTLSSSLIRLQRRYVGLNKIIVDSKFIRSHSNIAFHNG